MAKSFKELRKMIMEIRESQQETAESMKDTDMRLKETDKILKKLGIQIGGLGIGFGRMVQGLAFESISKILRENFSVDHVSSELIIYEPGTRNVRGEIDVFGYTNSAVNNAVVVEVKAQIRPEDVNGLQSFMNSFNDLLPGHANKNLFGMLATPGKVDDSLKKSIFKKGFYLATMSNDVLTLREEAGFVAKNFRKN